MKYLHISELYPLNNNYHQTLHILSLAMFHKQKGNPKELVLADIRKRMRDNLPITPKQSAFYEDCRKARNKERREYYHKTKDTMAVAARQKWESRYFV